MKAIVLHCAPGAQYHFGRIGADPDASLDSTSDFPHSDTLFSALVVTAAKAFPSQVKGLLTAFDSGQLRLSSGFYCLQQSDVFVWFLPKPVHFDLERLEGEDRKMVSRVQFLSAGVWKSGFGPKDWVKNCVFLQSKKLVALQNELDTLGIAVEDAGEIKVFDTATLPKVSVHKPTRENALFAQTNLQIADNRSLYPELRVNFYFLVDDQLPAELASVFQSVLSLLADEGFGGERSTGCGHIEQLSQHDFDLGLPDTGLCCAVSLVNPADDADLKLLQQYKITTRGGRRTLNDQQLSRVKMIAEGAVSKPGLKGRILDISAKQDKSYLRYGKALCLPMRTKPK